jgi:hypothetical protein
MQKIKAALLATEHFLDNSYLDKYVNLIFNNLHTKKETAKTQQHHILPRCYFKHLGKPCDNTKQNLVHLLYIDHVKAHHYLSMCLIDRKLACLNAHVVKFILDQRYTEADTLLEDILVTAELQKNYELSREYRRLNQTGRKASEETRRKMSNSAKGKPKPDSVKVAASRTHKGKVLSEETKEKIRATKLNNYKPRTVSDETRSLLSKRKLEYHKTHPGTRLGKKTSDETKAKHGKPVRCIETGIVYETLVWAAEAVGLKSSTGISAACSHKSGKLVGGYHWEYV